MPLPTTNLILDLQAGVGITSADAAGRVSAWADQSAAGNNATQSTAANQPYTAVDDNGDPCVRFPGQLSPETITTHLNLPAGFAITDTRHYTVLAVMRYIPTPTSPVDIISFGTWTFGGMEISTASNFAPFLLIGNQTPTPRQHVPAVKTILGCRTNTTTTDLITAYNTKSTSAVGSAGFTGGAIGRRNSNGDRYAFFDLYRLCVWNATLSDQDLTDAKAALASWGNVPTSYTKLAVLLGDSITQGTRTSQNQTYPARALPSDYLTYAGGWTGKRMGTSNTDSGSLRALRTSWVDPLYDGAMNTNLLVVMGGTNDLADAITGAQCYTRLTGLASEAKGANAWTVWASTIPSRQDSVAYATPVTDYNAAIVAFNPATDSIDDIIDPGKNGDAPLGRLTDATSGTYFYSDKVHPINLGSFVIASHLWAKATGSPLAPTSPALSSTQSDGATIAFTDASTGETGFHLQRRLQTAGSSWSTVASGASSPLTDTSASPETAYYYRVVSYNGTADSQNDGVVATTTAADSTPPVLGGSSAEITTDGLTLSMDLTEADSPPLLPETGVTGFSVTVDGVAKSYTSATRTGSLQIELAFAAPIYSGQTVLLSYDAGTGNVTDSAATPNALQSFSDYAVTNNSTAEPAASGGANRLALGLGLGL